MRLAENDSRRNGMVLLIKLDDGGTIPICVKEGLADDVIKHFVDALQPLHTVKFIGYKYLSFKDYVSRR